MATTFIIKCIIALLTLIWSIAFEFLLSGAAYVALVVEYLSQIFSVGYPLYYQGKELVINCHIHLDNKGIIIHEILFVLYSPAIYSWLRDRNVRYGRALTFIHYHGAWAFALRAAYICICLGTLDNANLYEVWTFSSVFYVVRYSFFLISLEEILGYEEKQRAMEIHFCLSHPDVLMAEARVLAESFL